MIAARLVSAAAFLLASTTLTDHTVTALPQAAGVSTTGYLNVTLSVPWPIPVDQTATAALTFTDIPEVDPSSGLEMFVNCEIRAPELGGDRGGPRGFITGCTYPGAGGMTLAEFNRQGTGMVTVDIREEWRGGKGVFFHVYVTAGPDSGRPFDQVTGGNTAPFDIAA